MNQKEVLDWSQLAAVLRDEPGQLWQPRLRQLPQQLVNLFAQTKFRESPAFIYALQCLLLYLDDGNRGSQGVGCDGRASTSAVPAGRARADGAVGDTVSRDYTLLLRREGQEWARETVAELTTLHMKDHDRGGICERGKCNICVLLSSWDRSCGAPVGGGAPGEDPGSTSLLRCENNGIRHTLRRIVEILWDIGEGQCQTRWTEKEVASSVYQVSSWLSSLLRDTWNTENSGAKKAELPRLMREAVSAVATWPEKLTGMAWRRKVLYHRGARDVEEDESDEWTNTIGNQNATKK